AKRFEMATSDDSPLNKQDGMCSVVAPADGTYYVVVRDSGYQGSGACAYRLHVGHFPRPQALVPAGGKAGEEIEVTFLGDPAGPIKQKVKVPNTPGVTVNLHCQDAAGISPSGIPFRVGDVGNAVEVEPNDSLAQATRAAAFPLAFNGIIEKDGDVDSFRFKGTKGQTFDVNCFGRRIGSPLDSVMYLYNAAGGAMVGNDDSAGPDSYFRVTIPADGEYILTVTDHLSKGGPTYFYRVEFTPVVPAATVSIPKVGLFSQERQVIAVPKGGRMASLVTVSRANFGGEVTVGAAGLPGGVAMQCENMAANLDTFPVVFEAAATAPVAGTLANLGVKHADPKHPPVGSQFNQMAELVTGGPGQSVYWKREVERLAVAVMDEAPYSVEIVEPKVPLIQNGSMALKVVAKRKPGFAGPITVVALWNPPGVGSASSATIAAGANETVLPMNAAANAEIKKWKTAVLAVADAGKGPVWTSSQLATVEVAAPFLVTNMSRSAVEQGKETEILVKLQTLTPFEGNATVKLYGLPFKAVTADLTATKDTKEVAFKITTDKATPAGIHRNLFCQVLVTRSGEVMAANHGYSELRVDVPVVKAAAPPPPPAPAAAVAKTPAPPTPPAPPKRLTRLEQLRKEQEEREKKK
ncbi:MAG: PPC domain-containing protein, partial [Gemmataceae bacterium]